MIKRIQIREFVAQPFLPPLVDVRAPAEYEKAHIPGAFSLPLFSDDERAKVGTTYKQKGREAAILLGFDLTGPKWRGFIEAALEIAPEKRITVHCWRGGMRSSVMAWALDLYGFEVSVIEGGYKSYRDWVLAQFEKKFNLQILGGMTGSRKTDILMEMRSIGEQVVDLEGLAHHHGSAFGSMGKLVQPTQQQFENNLAAVLYRMEIDQPIWVEDESRTIGKVGIPGAFWSQMREAPLIEIQVDKEERIDFLVEEYGVLDPDFLICSTERIQKRLGPMETTEAVKAIRERRIKDFIRLVLRYYDKTYQKGISKRQSERVFPFPVHIENIHQCALKILEYSREH